MVSISNWEEIGNYSGTCCVRARGISRRHGRSIFVHSYARLARSALCERIMECIALLTDANPKQVLANDRKRGTMHAHRVRADQIHATNIANASNRPLSSGPDSPLLGDPRRSRSELSEVVVDLTSVANVTVSPM